MSYRIGPQEQRVLDYLEEQDEPQTVMQVADALYDYDEDSETKRTTLARNWAWRIMRRLERKGGLVGAGWQGRERLFRHLPRNGSEVEDEPAATLLSDPEDLVEAEEEAVREALKGWRQAEGLTQREAAVKLGVSRGYLSQIENGKATVSDTIREKAEEVGAL